PLLDRGDGEGGGRVVGAELHFDECEQPATPGHQVDLADRVTEIARDDAIAGQPQPPCRDVLGPAPAPFGRLVGGGRPHAEPFRRASARAYTTPRCAPVVSATSATASRRLTRASASVSSASRSASFGRPSASMGGPTTITISPLGSGADA